MYEDVKFPPPSEPAPTAPPVPAVLAAAVLAAAVPLPERSLRPRLRGPALSVNFSPPPPLPDGSQPDPVTPTAEAMTNSFRRLTEAEKVVPGPAGSLFARAKFTLCPPPPSELETFRDEDFIVLVAVSKTKAVTIGTAESWEVVDSLRDRLCSVVEKVTAIERPGSQGKAVYVVASNREPGDSLGVGASFPSARAACHAMGIGDMALTNAFARAKGGNVTVRGITFSRLEPPVKSP